MTEDGVTGDGWSTEWLAAAVGGGLPEPGRPRWQPLRVGIVALWEYEEAEFWYADGRLVLRGGNGAGKTKVLELTTLMLLRGEISPSVLDPFGSQHRTMRFNLLPTGDGDDPRPPADAGLGYAWAEFGRVGPAGEPEFLVCGMGLSARRGSGTGGVTPWHFVTELRPGKDLRLAVGGRARNASELRQIDGVRMPPSATAYRELLANELYGLSPGAYDNLTELLKQLRRPKLGERLNPAELARMLRASLPPLATTEIGQLADGWDHLELLRVAVDRTRNAAVAVATFVRDGWRPWTRALLRQRANDLSRATTGLDNTTRARNEAETKLTESRLALEAAETGLTESEQSKGEQEERLQELIESSAYQDAVSANDRVDRLRQAVRNFDLQVTGAEGRATSARTATGTIETWHNSCQAGVDEAEAVLQTAEQGVRDAALDARLEQSAATHLPKRDLDALLSDQQARADRFARLRRLHHAHAAADRKSGLIGERVQAAADDAERAGTDHESAVGLVDRGAEALRQQIREWAANARVAAPADTMVEDWCELVADLTVIDEQGVARPGPPVTSSMRAYVEGQRQRLEERRAEVRLERAPVVDRLQAAGKELGEVRERLESPPPEPSLWTRRERPAPEAELGAPLWQLVNPADGLSGEQLDLVEAALAASGLLDAWVAADGSIDLHQGRLLVDTQVIASAGEARPGLLEVLAPSAAGGVPPEVTGAVLAGVGWYAEAPADVAGDWLAADGSWRVGGLTGRAELARPAAYVGAAARAAARERAIVRLEEELAGLAARLEALDGVLDELAETFRAIDRGHGALPDAAERELVGLVSTLADRARRLASAAHELDTVRETHRQQLALRDGAWAAFAEFATEHAFGLHDLDDQGRRITDYATRLQQMSGALDQLGLRRETLTEAERQLGERREALATAEADVVALVNERSRLEVRLKMAEETLSTDHAEQLARRDELAADIKRLAGRIAELGGKVRTAIGVEATAKAQLEQHEESRVAAEIERDAAMAALGQAVEAGLAEPLELVVPERWTVQSAREFAAGVRRAITLGETAADVDRAWRRCYGLLEQLRQSLLPDRDARVRDDEDEVGLPAVGVLTDPEQGWLSPLRASDVLAERVAEQQRQFDAEQQRVLTTLLESTFIEHLKIRLDYTARTLERINAQLAAHPTRHGHVVRIRWAPDPADPDAKTVVTILRQGFQQLSADRQDNVREFVRRRIEEAREDAISGGVADWKDELARALDYREWIRLDLEYRLGTSGAWSVFDAAKHGAKSGGEKVVLLSQPLFAAAVVAYDAAAEHAPRCVWLDEAMTGVDTAVKASFMGLTVDFELDVMLTAHDEWCTYPTVPAVAIYDLARHPHVPGVDIETYLWSGGERTQLSIDRLGVPKTSAEGMDEGLFAPDSDD